MFRNVYAYLKEKKKNNKEYYLVLVIFFLYKYIFILLSKFSV